MVGWVLEKELNYKPIVYVKVLPCHFHNARNDTGHWQVVPTSMCVHHVRGDDYAALMARFGNDTSPVARVDRVLRRRDIPLLRLTNGRNECFLCALNLKVLLGFCCIPVCALWALWPNDVECVIDRSASLWSVPLPVLDPWAGAGGGASGCPLRCAAGVLLQGAHDENVRVWAGSPMNDVCRFFLLFCSFANCAIERWRGFSVFFKFDCALLVLSFPLLSPHLAVCGCAWELLGTYFRVCSCDFFAN
ncbi:UDP-Gal or UDP-GlcNAc-dependent glycosyltransferase, putative [Trypanosoma cruzi marinkellei]|uniref:UDP-Gal or UDP-GlcNAc-dependent glycosyltransferase, putative n=1 Tax=Trypanosoma cruzi marinkellei TaxID=85056 RepID=K2M3D6_TRYCR|nr:UDP-Gal or UDP-GlcNAc-dependent glycosyltransferase, putative [Trypanosoma cruzi marinkellei]